MRAGIDAKAFAAEWTLDWNRKDVDAVLSHFADNVVFTSARAADVLGSPRVEGKSNLRKYWTTAISRIRTLHFTLDHVICEGDRIGIVYTAEIDGRSTRAVEFLKFGEDGLVQEGEAMYGVQL